MNPRTRRVALYVIGLVAMLASIDALAHSYTGLYEWAAHHRLSGWQAMSWPGEIDVFLVVGELALYVAYLDAWPARQRVWPWVTAIVGLIVSVAGNIGHVMPSPGAAVTFADRATAAISPVAAFAGLMIGLLVLKMNTDRASVRPSAALRRVSSGSEEQLPDTHISPVVGDAVRIVREARANGESVSQREIAARLRRNGHRFSNSQLREIAQVAYSYGGRTAA